MAARGRLSAGEGAEDETKNSKFAKPWNQQFHFWRLASPSQIGRGGRLAAPGREARGTGAESQVTLTAKELDELRTL